MKINKRIDCCDVACNLCDLFKSYMDCPDNVLEFAVCDCCHKAIDNTNKVYIEYTNRNGEIKDFCCDSCYQEYVLEEADEYVEEVDTDFEYTEEWCREAHEAHEADSWYDAWKVGDL